jgi:hypothetical protein
VCGMITSIFYFTSLHNELMMVDALKDVTSVFTTFLDLRLLTTSLMKRSNSFGNYSYFQHMFGSDILSRIHGPTCHWCDFNSYIFPYLIPHSMARGFNPS